MVNARARALAAEAIGTFALVFVGTGAMVVDVATGGAVGHVGISLAFGLIVMAMIYAVGDVSGAHFNPAVTLGFWWAGRFPGAGVGPYLVSQFGAALFASVLLRLSFPDAASYGETLPHAGIGAALLFEIVLTSFLMFVILGITTQGRIEGGFAGLAIGASVTLASLAGGPVSGASMNPARSFGPAVVSGEWSIMWLYFVAPLGGALLAVRACRLVRGAECCAAADSVAASP
jgi:aquaporin Z